MANARQLAEQIALNPRLRERLVKDPLVAVEMVVPAKRLSLGVDKEARKLREEVLAELTEVAKNDPELGSSRHADAVIKQFFKEAIRNPQISFQVILIMSIDAFIAGLGFAIAGLAIGLAGDREVLGSVFGASGVFGTLGSVLLLARNSVNHANANDAQMRLIVTVFATELGHLCALDLKTLSRVKEVNGKIREAMEAAVELIQQNVKDEASKEEPQGETSSAVPGTATELSGSTGT